MNTKHRGRDDSDKDAYHLEGEQPDFRGTRDSTDQAQSQEVVNVKVTASSGCALAEVTVRDKEAK